MKLLAALIAIVPFAANAIPITVDPGDTVILNFDLSGASPPPPYDNLLAEVILTDVELADIMSVVLYTELDGAGTAVFGGTVNGIGQFIFSAFSGDPNSSDILDGIFSWVVSGVSGSFAIDSATAEGFTSIERDVGTGSVGPIEVITSVPEPGTLSLLAIGLAGFTFARRRRNV